ncbi:hypothetical protein AUJ68_04305 [Candidatus Woesearchaeota archaeon CG1_02_57_44]|nr:MAG: hypothetical protein AUJ68_04305 [Candidatus Woesearchaeota archaeon CG1_02_57_44]
MDSALYLSRAENELVLADIIMRLSSDAQLQQRLVSTQKPLTFYSAVISHAYYCMFYAAKAYLLHCGIQTKPPEEHRKTCRAFARVWKAVNGDPAASTLQQWLREERDKRSSSAYHRSAQHNRKPAQASLDRARIFYPCIYARLHTSDKG